MRYEHNLRNHFDQSCCKAIEKEVCTEHSESDAKKGEDGRKCAMHVGKCYHGCNAREKENQQRHHGTHQLENVFEVGPKVSTQERQTKP